ncbi:MAG: hypothetical protein E4H01_01190 [Lysobacterales bacterium]|nr:MAG: hypothetical protein E4H01_01190 [Xanthomonadales bacterium]
MAKRVVEYDPFTGMTTTFDYDHSTDTTTVGLEQDVSLLLDVNKVLQNDANYSKDGIKRDWWHYASIPSIIIEKWLNEDGVNVFDKDHTKAVYKKLNDPAYRYLKTTAGFHKPK